MPSSRRSWPPADTHGARSGRRPDGGGVKRNAPRIPRIGGRTRVPGISGDSTNGFRWLPPSRSSTSMRSKPRPTARGRAAEWEYAANAAGSPSCANLDHRSAGPGAADAAGGGLAHLFGNVWEWTATTFQPYPGFAADPYADYSVPWFGDHQVLRGGSFATRSRLVHSRWRNFYRPERSDMFAGFRTCAL